MTARVPADQLHRAVQVERTRELEQRRLVPAELTQRALAEVDHHGALLESIWKALLLVDEDPRAVLALPALHRVRRLPAIVQYQV